MWVSYQTAWVRALGFIPAPVPTVCPKCQVIEVWHKLQKIVSGLTCLPESPLTLHFCPLQNLSFSCQISSAFKKIFYCFTQPFQFFHWGYHSDLQFVRIRSPALSNGTVTLLLLPLPFGIAGLVLLTVLIAQKNLGIPLFLNPYF